MPSLIAWNRKSVDVSISRERCLWRIQMEALVLAFFGSEDVQMAQEQAMHGIPWDVPVPRKIICIVAVYQKEA